MSALPLKAGMLSVSIDVGQCQKQTFDLLAFLFVTDGPDIGGDGLEIAVRQTDAAKWRHGTGMLLRLRNAILDDVGDALKTAVAPEPRAAREVGADRRADSVSAVTSGAGCSGHLAMKDLLAERDLLSGSTRWHRKTWCGASIGMNAFGRKGAGRDFGLGR